MVKIEVLLFKCMLVFKFYYFLYHLLGIIKIINSRWSVIAVLKCSKMTILKENVIYFHFNAFSVFTKLFNKVLRFLKNIQIKGSKF